ncbi:hypothetical protein AMATHDRAFT_69284 [Amanita thiersii Skay4041]|uniref:Cytochrome P450 n=1 Tax=Amanita thiersii Skay4041 TaxID=703135 RepID=A0A2A9N8I5_9AGAR|nr:hypothetical protein AMATHDRAFT_69284 [Amanita thiersii Skay4041]
MAVSPLYVICIGAATYLVYRRFKQNKNGLLPPGPKGIPIVGNVADMPTEKDWLTYAEWGRKYGGICSVTLLGQPMMIVNSAEIMEELDRKGSIYSDRPRLEMGGELVGYSETLVLIPYGARFRTYRKHFARMIGGISNVEKLHGMLEGKVRQFLRHILATPDNLLPHLRTLTGGIILQLTYGIEVQENKDPFVELIENANANFNAATIPGAFVVDFFPSLRDLPEWLPGMGFMETARKWLKDTVDMVEIPYAYTKQQMAAGNAPPSFVSTLLEHEDSLSPEDIRDIKYTASSLYGGGADTTVSAEYAFFLAMVLNPDIQKKAQEEIDAVIGRNRLPTLADRSQLPYVNAIVMEVLRWNSVAPTGVPHRAIQDGVVGGFFIPKGSLIVVNLWNMLHDPTIYPEPFSFRPERHIPSADGTTPAQRDPRTICFGFGRRVCPGMFLAEASLFLTVASSLALFSISKAVENGVEITPVHENTSGTISYPKPFKCAIKPRSSQTLSLLAEEATH